MTVREFTAWVRCTLGGVRLFSGVATDTVVELGERARWHECEPGTVLIREGQTVTSCLALVQGTTRIRYADGRRDVDSQPGVVLGLRLSFYDAPSWATVRTLAPSLVAEIRREDLLHGMAVSPALATNVARLLTTRTSHLSPRERLDTQMMRALRDAVGGAPDGRGVTALPHPIDPAVWATLLGVDRGDVERSLLRLKRHGIVRGTAKRVTHVDLERLNDWLR